jgi:hypothetical protein
MKLVRYIAAPQLVVAALALALLLALAVTVVGAAAAAPGGQPLPPALGPTPAKAGEAPPPPAEGIDAELIRKQESLLPAAHSLAEQARDPSSDIGGVSIDVDTGVVDVYRKNTHAPLQLGGAPVTVNVHPAKFSRAEMIAASKRIIADARALADLHVGVEAIGPSVDGSGLDVTVFATDDAAVEGAAAILRTRYGNVVGTVHGSATKPSDDDLYFGGFRFNDYPAWYGGDRIMTASGGGCTSGFAATYNSAPAMLTAAHCGPVGTAWYNGPRSDGSWKFLGTTNSSNASTDVATIGVSSTSLSINVGYDPQWPTQLYISSWATPVVGQYLCQSGSYTGERCWLKVVDTTQYVCTGWTLWWCSNWTGPFADAISAYGSASPAAGHGDSGGPVYLALSGYGIAEGLVHGPLTPNAQNLYPAYYPDTLWCPSPEGWKPRCSSGFSFAHMPGR